MTHDEKLKDLERRQREIADEIKALQEEEKPLYWTELPEGAYFRFPDDLTTTPFKTRVSFGEYYLLLFDNLACKNSIYTETPVTRVNLDGTPYKGDPRK